MQREGGEFRHSVEAVTSGVRKARGDVVQGEEQESVEEEGEAGRQFQW